MNKSHRIGVRLNNQQFHNLNVYCKHKRTTKSHLFRQIANILTDNVTVKHPKEAYQIKRKRSSVIDSNSQLISSIDQLFRQSKANYRQTAGLANNLNQIALKVNGDENINLSGWQALKMLWNTTQVNKQADDKIYRELRELEKEIK